MNHKVMGLRDICTHKDNLNGINISPFPFRRGPFWFPETWGVNNWLPKNSCGSDLAPKTLEFVIATTLCCIHCNPKTLWRILSLSRGFLFWVVHVSPCCLQLLTSVHSFTNSLIIRGVEKFFENFSPHFGAFIDILNPHWKSLPFPKPFLKRPH